MYKEALKKLHTSVKNDFMDLLLSKENHCIDLSLDISSRDIYFTDNDFEFNSKRLLGEIKLENGIIEFYSDNVHRDNDWEPTEIDEISVCDLVDILTTMQEFNLA